MSLHVIPHKHQKIRHSGKHICISDQLYLFFFPDAYKVPNVVKVKMTIMVIAILDFDMPSCYCIIDGIGCSVIIYCTSIVHSWGAASVL